MTGVKMKKVNFSRTIISNRNPLKNERGFAVIESIAMIIIFLTMISYTIGFWGVIHTATLHSIASRNYAMEIFRHRSNLWYFRGNAPSPLHYHNYGSRIHGTNNDALDGVGSRQLATERRVAMFAEHEATGRSANDHI